MKICANLLLCLSILVPVPAFAEAEFDLDGFSPTGTVADIYKQMSKAEYGRIGEPAIMGASYFPDQLLPESILRADSKYSKFNLPKMFRNEIQGMNGKTLRFGGIQQFAYCQNIGNFWDASQNINPVLALQFRGEIVKNEVLAVFSRYYGTPEKLTGDAYRWRGKTQVAVFQKGELYIGNNVEIDKVAKLVLQKADNQLAGVEEAQPVFEEHKKQGALQGLQKKANEGDPEATRKLAEYYDSDEYGQRNPQVARDYLRKAAELGDAVALGEWGRLCVEESSKAPETIKPCLPWLKKGAELNDAEAQISLGGLYLAGMGVEKDHALAFKWFSRAAEQNIPVAQYALGEMYSEGFGTAPDPQKAAALFRAAAENGSINAQVALAAKLIDGDGIAKDEKEAINWLKLAAKSNDSKANHLLGYCYEKGIGVKANKNDAVRYYTKVAEQGDPQMQVTVGLAYANGKGVGKDVKTGVAWFKKAALQGYADGQYFMGLACQHGQGTPKNLSEAAKWYKLATAQGHQAASDNLAALQKGK